MEEPLTTEEPAPKLAGDLGAQERARSLIGRVISDRYRIAELLAMGGMGAVYRGEHVLLKKRIAIKILHPEIENLPELVTRFEREAIVGAHLHHPNMAAATDFGKLDDGSFFLVLEYVRGKTLYQAIRNGPLAPARAIHIARQLASALGAAHAKGVVHRDVKPRNVMLIEGQNDLAKLIDFGLAKVSVEQLTVTDSLRSARLDEAERWRSHGSEGDRERSLSNEGDRITDVGVIFGTIAYLAPEAAHGMDSVDARADLYALGIVFYEMLTGLHPFQGVDAVELFKHQRYSPPPPFAKRNPDVRVPPELEAVVMRLLEKAPWARYQSGNELIAALDDVSRQCAELPPSVEVVPVDLSSADLAAIVSPAGAVRSPAGKPATPPEGAREAKALPDEEERDGAQEGEAKAAEGDAEVAEGEAEAETDVETDAAAPPPSASEPASLAEVLGTLPEGARDTPPPPAARVGAAVVRPRRPPYLLGATLLMVAAGLLLFTRLRSAQHPPAEDPANAALKEPSSAAPGPRLQGSSNAEPGPAAEGPVAEATAPDPSAAPPVGSGVAPSGGAPDVVAPNVVAADAGASAASSVPAELASVDDAGLRVIVIQAARAREWPTAEGAMLALVDRDPDAFKRAEVIGATREVIVGLEREGEGDKVFDAIVNRLGSTGLDLLYEIVEAKGGSRAAARAGDLLRKDEVRARESPALRVAIELRDAPCVDKLKLLKRAVKDGDGRALVVMQTLGVACFRKSRELDQAISQLRSKLLKP